MRTVRTAPDQEPPCDETAAETAMGRAGGLGRREAVPAVISDPVHRPRRREESGPHALEEGNLHVRLEVAPASLDRTLEPLEPHQDGTAEVDVRLVLDERVVAGHQRHGPVGVRPGGDEHDRNDAALWRFRIGENEPEMGSRTEVPA